MQGLAVPINGRIITIKEYKTMNEQINELWDYILDNGLASEEALRLITNINGYNLEALEAVLYATTGYRSLEQIKEAE